MAFTQAQADAIDVALATGVLRVTYEGKTTEFHSMDEMLKLRQLIKDELAVAASTIPDRFARVGFTRD